MSILKWERIICWMSIYFMLFSLRVNSIQIWKKPYEVSQVFVRFWKCQNLCYHYKRNECRTWEQWRIVISPKWFFFKLGHCHWHWSRLASTCSLVVIDLRLETKGCKGVLSNVKPTGQIHIHVIFVEHSHDIFPECSEKVPYQIPGNIP